MRWARRLTLFLQVDHIPIHADDRLAHYTLLARLDDRVRTLPADDMPAANHFLILVFAIPLLLVLLRCWLAIVARGWSARDEKDRAN